MKCKDKQGKFNNKEDSDSSKGLRIEPNENIVLPSSADKKKIDIKPPKMTKTRRRKDNLF